jgi:hypothetical protein
MPPDPQELLNRFYRGPGSRTRPREDHPDFIDNKRGPGAFGSAPAARLRQLRNRFAPLFAGEFPALPGRAERRTVADQVRQALAVARAEKV